MSARPRHGFTLVELLVVISIIGMLMALIVPAVIAARDEARRIQCTNRLSELVLAIQQYESAKQRLPGWNNRVAPLAHQFSWVVPILPNASEKATYDNIVKTLIANANATLNLPVPALVCPADSTKSSQGGAALSYACNAGIEDDLTKSFPNARDFPFNGVFQNRYYDSSTELLLSAISQWDGLNTTIALTENIDATTYMAEGTGAAVPLNEFSVGVVWSTKLGTNVGTLMSPSQTLPNLMRTNRRLGAAPQPGFYQYALPSSYHSGVVMVGFCGRTVKPMAFNVDYKVYGALMTPRGEWAHRATVSVPPTDPLFNNTNMHQLNPPVDESMLNP